MHVCQINEWMDQMGSIFDSIILKCQRLHFLSLLSAHPFSPFPHLFIKTKDKMQKCSHHSLYNQATSGQTDQDGHKAQTELLVGR